MGGGKGVGKADDFIETFEFEINGEPSEETLTMLRKAPGVDLAVRPVGFGGQIRLGER